MKYLVLALTGPVLAACTLLQPASPPVSERRAEFISVVEAAGCRLHQSENEDVLVPAGFSDAEAGALGGLLVSEGVAELAEDGDLVLLTESCL